MNQATRIIVKAISKLAGEAAGIDFDDTSTTVGIDSWIMGVE